jgi:hypothetical protein
MKALKLAALVCVGALALAGLPLLVLWAVLPAPGNSEYETWPVDMVRSPDHAWVAVVRVHLCSAFLAGTDKYWTVQLLRPEERRSDPSEVFAVDGVSHREDRLILDWLGRRKLQITAPNKSLISVKRREFEDVRTVIDYIGDDPAERALFQKEHGLPPD